MPYVGELLAMGLGKEVTLGTFVDPAYFLPYIPPFHTGLTIQLLESKGIRALPDMVYKVTQGKEEFKGIKVKIEMEPDNIGPILQACFGLDTITGTTAYTHTFARQSVVQLPTYTLWANQGAQYTEIGGCMLNKLDLAIKAGELITAESDWSGTAYQASVTKTVSYSAVQPFAFNTAAISVGGTTINDYDDCKLSIDNFVKAEHVLNAKITPGKIYSEGMKVQLSLDMYLESGNLAQWSTDFLNGTAQAVVITLTHPGFAYSTTIHYSLTINLPVVNYQTAPFANAQAVIKIPFAAVAVYDTATTKTVNAVLVNDVSTAY